MSNITKYDDIIVGSGISGLTMSLILALNGRKVLLLEKSPAIGGSMSRFYRKGIPFDTGFHFTGGLQKDGILDDILSVLGIRDLIEPIFLTEEKANQFILESEGKIYELPCGIERMKNKLKGYFPTEAGAIDSYFDKVKSVCDRTPSMNLRMLDALHTHLDEDYVSLDDVLNGLTQNSMLKALLCGFAMCYGVKPQEVSFANHSRICIGLYESVARVKGGGGAFIKAFKTRFMDRDIEIRCGTYIAEMADISDHRVGRFILNTGEEVSADNCILTIHPKEIVKILPAKHMSKAFMNRVASFEPAAGFFSVFSALDPGDDDPDFDASIVTLLPDNDINKLLDAASEGDSALVLIRSVEHEGGRIHKVINTCEPSAPEDVASWKDFAVGKRPQAYYDYKKRKVERTMERIFTTFPAYRGHLKAYDSASILTFRDYLHNYDGSAYGIKQKMGQYNLFGKLPLRNLYAAGQNSLLPGIIGAMMSSFIVGRSLIKEEQYNSFLRRNLCS
jgi:phytoene dehydrogenase-like protein